MRLENSCYVLLGNKKWSVFFWRVLLEPEECFPQFYKIYLMPGMCFPKIRRSLIRLQDWSPQKWNAVLTLAEWIPVFDCTNCLYTIDIGLSLLSSWLSCQSQKSQFGQLWYQVKLNPAIGPYLFVNQGARHPLVNPRTIFLYVPIHR
jgi:hypothetical protein